MLRPRRCADLVFETSATSLYLPAFRGIFRFAICDLGKCDRSVQQSSIGNLEWLTRMAARVGLAPTPNGLTGRRATFTLPGNGAHGRNLTFIFGVRSTALYALSYASKSSPGAQETDPAITSIVRDLCRQTVSTRVDFEMVGTAGFRLPKSCNMDAQVQLFASANCNHLRPRGPKVLAHGRHAL